MQHRLACIEHQTPRGTGWGGCKQIHTYKINRILPLQFCYYPWSSSTDVQLTASRLPWRKRAVVFGVFSLHHPQQVDGELSFFFWHILHSTFLFQTCKETEELFAAQSAKGPGSGWRSKRKLNGWENSAICVVLQSAQYLSEEESLCALIC